MDWHSWLSKSNLDHGLIHEYSLLLSHNELEEEDIVHFNHELLQSMGISTAKHRLEILKLAKKHSKAKPPWPDAGLLAAAARTGARLAGYVRSLVRRDDSAIVVVPRPSRGGPGWKGALLKRSKRMALRKQGRLMLAGGGATVAGPNSASRRTSRTACGGRRRGEAGRGDGFWWSGAEEIRWDSMFQDLKPT